ncbi:MAG: hypothetical protein IPI84_09015 [Holophagaceae bacterium]|nr:hypothetical protein [Holophagaceae bacterium]
MSTVLVVDDDPNVRQILREYVEREGHRVLEAADSVTRTGPWPRSAWT